MTRTAQVLAYEQGDRTGPSDSFVRRTRNPDVVPPDRVVRTDKRPGDVVISTLGRAPLGQALVFDRAATRLAPSGFDPSRIQES